MLEIVGNEDWIVVCFVQLVCEFVDCCCFIGVLQVVEYEYGWVVFEFEFVIWFIEQFDEFVVNDFEDLLIWCQVVEDVFVECFFFYLFDELMYDFEVYVGFEQGEVNFVYCVLDVFGVDVVV